jgi:hypothetical protein
MISFTLIMVWGSVCSLGNYSPPLFFIGSLILAAGFVYENRRQLRPSAAGGDGSGRLLTRYGPLAAGLFLGLFVIAAEMIPYAFFHIFHPK